MASSDRKKLEEIADDFTDSFPAVFRRVSRGATHPGSKKFDPSRVVLRIAVMHGPVCMSGVCKHMGISKPYMTALVDKLINEGLVERVPNPDDRRVVEIKITDAGRRVTREFTKDTRETIVKNLSSLDSKDISTLHSSMKNIRKVISRLDQDRSSECSQGEDV